MSTFNIEQIRQAIDSLQKIHPCNGVFDVTKIDNENGVDAIKNVIDKYIEKAMKDTEIYLICEMAKQYLNGARPTYERPTGEWIKADIVTFGSLYDLIYKCSICNCHKNGKTNYCPNCGAKMKSEGEE